MGSSHSNIQRQKDEAYKQLDIKYAQFLNNTSRTYKDLPESEQEFVKNTVRNMIKLEDLQLGTNISITNITEIKVEYSYNNTTYSRTLLVNNYHVIHDVIKELMIANNINRKYTITHYMDSRAHRFGGYFYIISFVNDANGLV